MYFPGFIERTFFSFLLALLISTASMAGETKKLPLWQVGAVVGGLSMPHYTGSDQRHIIPLVFPSFIYRGERLRASREGVRGLFYSSKNVAVDVGLSGGIPVYSSSNDARNGMPDIPLTVEIGPRLVIRPYEIGDAKNILLRIPLRIVGGIDGSTSGWTLGPNLLVTNIRLPLNLNAFAILGLKYGSAEYNNLYYGVEKRYSRSTRPAYRAKQGISWYSFLFSAGRKFNSNFSARIYLQWNTLSGSVVADSPLVKNQNFFGGGLWLTWLPWKSKTMEKDIDRLPEPEEEP